MTLSNSFSIGNYIIDSDNVFIISKIEDSRIYYLPVETDGRLKTVTGSIPQANILSSGFRHLLTPEDIDRFFSDLAAAKKPEEIPVDSKTYKDIVCQNNPFSIIPLLKQLWTNKNNPHTIFSGSNRDILENIFKHLSQEFSLVTKKSPEYIRNKIIATLRGKSNPAPTKS